MKEMHNKVVWPVNEQAKYRAIDQVVSQVLVQGWSQVYYQVHDQVRNQVWGQVVFGDIKNDEV